MFDEFEYDDEMPELEIEEEATLDTLHEHVFYEGHYILDIAPGCRAVVHMEVIDPDEYTKYMKSLDPE